MINSLTGVRTQGGRGGNAGWTLAVWRESGNDILIRGRTATLCNYSSPEVVLPLLALREQFASELKLDFKAVG